MAKQQKQSLGQALSSVAPQGGGGDFAGTAQALQAFIESISSGASNLMQVMQEQQIQAAEQAQQMAGQTANEVTQVLSNVASAGQRAEEERKARKEQEGDREYAEESALWQRELQQESALWAAHLAQKIQEQEDGRLSWIKDHERKVDSYQDYRDALRSDIDQKMQAGYFVNMPNGIEEYNLMMKALEHSEAFLEDQRGAPYLTWAVQRRNAAIEQIYQQEAKAMGTELTPRSGDLMPLPNPAQPVEGDLPFFDSATIRDVVRGQGYPQQGVSSINPNDPVGRHVNPYTMKSAIWHMQADQNLRMLATQKGRKMLEDGYTKKLLQANDALKPLVDVEEEMAQTYESIADQAIHEGVMSYIADPNPQKTANPAENITRRIIDATLRTPGGDGSKKAYALMNGELVIEGQDGIQLGLGMYSLGQVMAEKIRLTLGDPNSGAAQALLAEMQSRSQDPLKQFGRVQQGKTTDPGQKATMLYRELWGTMSQVSGNFNRLKRVAYEQGPVKGLYDELAVVRRAIDTQATVLQSEDEGGHDLTPEKIQNRLKAVQEGAEPSEGFRRNIGYLEGMAIRFKDQPNPVGAIHNLLSGGKAGIQNPNEPTFQAILTNQEQADPLFSQQMRAKREKKKQGFASNLGAGMGFLAGAAKQGASNVAGAIGEGASAVKGAVGGAASSFMQGAQQGAQAGSSMVGGQPAPMQAPGMPPGGPAVGPMGGNPQMNYQNQQQRAMGQPVGPPPQQPQNPLQQLGRQ